MERGGSCNQGHVIFSPVRYGMQYAADQCAVYLLVRLQPNIGVPGAAVHWWSLLPDEVCHLNTPSRVPVQTHKQTNARIRLNYQHRHSALPPLQLNRWYRVKSAIYLVQMMYSWLC